MSSDNKETEKVARDVMHYAGLDLGCPKASKRVLYILDLEVNVYGLDEIAGSTRDVAVACLSHGWANKSQHLEGMATGLLGEARRISASSRKPARDLICVVLDHRNHGARYRGKDNLSFGQNPKIMLQMQATLLGAQADYSLVMNMLSSYLWPLDERRIAEWLFAGVSLGGHMVWRLLREDPRVRVGVPIASVPPETLAMFITGSGSEYDIPVEGTAAAVRDYFSTQTLPSDFTGKHILSLHGGADPIMGLNRMQDTLTRIGAYADHFEIYAEPGIGHQVTPEMVRRTAAWFWRFGMCEEGAKL